MIVFASIPLLVNIYIICLRVKLSIQLFMLSGYSIRAIQHASRPFPVYYLQNFTPCQTHGFAKLNTSIEFPEFFVSMAKSILITPEQFRHNEGLPVLFMGRREQRPVLLRISKAVLMNC